MFYCTSLPAVLKYDHPSCRNSEAGVGRAHIHMWRAPCMYMLKARHISWKEQQARELRLTRIQGVTVHAHECVVEVDAPTSGPRCVAPGLRGLRGSSGGASIPRAPPPEAQKGRAYCEIPPRKHRPMLTPLDSVCNVQGCSLCGSKT